MPALRDDTFESLARLMHSAVGLSFASHKKPLVASRLAPRIQRLGLHGGAGSNTAPMIVPVALRHVRRHYIVSTGLVRSSPAAAR